MTEATTKARVKHGWTQALLELLMNLCGEVNLLSSSAFEDSYREIEVFELFKEL